VTQILFITKNGQVDPDYDDPVLMPEPFAAPVQTPTGFRAKCATCGAKLGNPNLDFEHHRGHCDPNKFHRTIHLSDSCKSGMHMNCGNVAFRWNNQTLGTSGMQICPCQCHPRKDREAAMKKLEAGWTEEQRIASL